MSTLTVSTLAETVSTVAGDPRLWRRHVRFTPGARYWHRLAQLPDADLWLLTWMPDQQTDLHDHGDAHAAFTVVSGQLEEVRVRAGGRIRRTLSPGALAWLPPGAVHDVGNRSTEPAISIHAYSPRLSAMTFWDLGPDGLRRGATVLTDEPEV
jgi:mannose-6-phosphate isomerase-like protein (cupin superfamily)